MVVSCKSISASRIDCLSGSRIVQFGDFPGSGKTSYTRFILTSPEAAAEYPGTPAQITIGTMNGTSSTRSSIRLAHSDGSITISSSSSITFNQGGSKINLPNKAGTIALTDDIPNALSCSTPSVFYGVVGVNTISSGFNIYRNLSLKLSYGVLYCFCSNTMTPGQGFKQTAYAIGFRINESASEDEEIYAIMSSSDFIIGGYYEYPLKLE